MDVFCQREYLFICRDACVMKLTAGPSVWLPLRRVMLIECAALLSSIANPSRHRWCGRGVDVDARRVWGWRKKGKSRSRRSSKSSK